MNALERHRDVDGADWPPVTRSAPSSPGRAGEYRTAGGHLVAGRDGESYITMEDSAVAFVDELGNGDPIHSQLGAGY